MDSVYAKLKLISIVLLSNIEQLPVFHFGGFAASGGSALRDFFNEFEKIFLFPCEFRLLKEKNGLLDLEDTLFNSKSPDNIDLAIKDFMILCNNFARITTKFKRRGLNYDKYTNGKFSLYIKDFITNLIDYKYPLNTHNLDFRKNYFQSQFDRLIQRFLPYSYYEQEAFMCYPMIDKYIYSAKKLISSILIEASKQTNIEPSIIGLHNLVNPYTKYHVDKSFNYFDNLKMIFIDRDPRDIFIDFPHNRYLPNDSTSLEKAICFVDFFKVLRAESKNFKNYENVLFINFEEFILNHEETKKTLENFLGIKFLSNINSYKYFSPYKSIKNIGKYKYHKSKNLEAFNYIEQELKQYLFEN